MTLLVYSAILILCTTYFCVLIQAKDYYFSDFCDTGKPANLTIRLYGSSETGSIKASSRDWYNSNKDCDIILIPPAGDGIVLSVEDMNLYRPGVQCVDSVTIAQYSYGVWNDWRSICDKSGKTDYMNDGMMRITFKTSRDPGYFRTGKGFNIVYTTYYRPCWKADSFLCSPNNICISKYLVCNGINNCGDGSDESFSECQSTYAILGGVIGSIFIMIVVAGFIRRRRRATERSATETTPSPQTQTPNAYADNVTTQTNPAYAEDELPSYDDLEHSDPPKTPPDEEPPPYVNVEVLSLHSASPTFPYGLSRMDGVTARPNNTQPQH